MNFGLQSFERSASATLCAHCLTAMVPVEKSMGGAVKGRRHSHHDEKLSWPVAKTMDQLSAQSSLRLLA